MSAANGDNLRRLVGRFGVKACYKALTQVHGFDPDIAWLAIWYCRHNALPRRMGWAMDTRGVTAAPMTHDEALGFLDEYTNNRGRWSTPNVQVNGAVSASAPAGCSVDFCETRISVEAAMKHRGRWADTPRRPYPKNAGNEGRKSAPERIA